MSGRFVRASKFRHVHGKETRKIDAYTGISRLQTSGDSNFVAGNGKFLAYAVGGGGGPVVVHDRTKFGRLPTKPPVINVHGAKVLDFAFSPFMENMLATAGDDAYACVTVFPEDGLKENISTASAKLQGHQKKVNLLQFHPVASNLLVTSSADKCIKLWDIQSQSESLSYDGFGGNIQGFNFNKNGSVLAATCADKNIRFYDPRDDKKINVIKKAFSSPKAAKCVWADKYLIATGFEGTDRMVKMWDPKKLSEPLKEQDIDRGTGTLMPFYDPGNRILYLGGRGDGSIRYFEVDGKNIYYLSQYRSNTPQKGLCMLPKATNRVKKCEIALFLRLLRDCIIPVSMVVPRKSDLFQKDIYPPAYAGIPGLTAGEWLEGKNKDPPTMSMEPGAQKANGAAKATFKAKKSYAELEKEVAALKKKVAELEKQLKDKK